MTVAYVLHFYLDEPNVEQLHKRNFTSIDWAEHLANLGVKVVLIGRFHSSIDHRENGVQYHYIADNLPPRIKAHHVAYKFNRKAIQLCRKHKADIILLHDLNNVLPLFQFRSSLPDVALLLQDHSGIYRKRFQPFHYLNLPFLDGLIFAAKGQEEAYVKRKLTTADRCFFIMENSSHFKPIPKQEAIAQSGLTGEPIFLWVGNLTRNKDPFTVFKALAILKNDRWKMYMIYRFDDLLAEVQSAIVKYQLQDQVQLLGPRQREELPLYFSAADYFISASHKEGSGYALIEAMSCGLHPIVTDIPSFLSLTDNGRIGDVWKRGDSNSLLSVLQDRLKKPSQSSLVQQHFRENFSFEALARQTLQCFEKVLERRKND